MWITSWFHNNTHKAHCIHTPLHLNLRYVNFFLCHTLSNLQPPISLIRRLFAGRRFGRRRHRHVAGRTTEKSSFHYRTRCRVNPQNACWPLAHPWRTRQVRGSRDHHTAAMTSSRTTRSDSSRADSSFVTAGLYTARRHTDTQTNRPG